MDYIEEKYASGRITGQIKIHQKEDFQGMRKVGKLAAELLDLFVKKVNAEPFRLNFFKSQFFWF